MDIATKKGTDPAKKNILQGRKERVRDSRCELLLLTTLSFSTQQLLS
ncbi:hypothetical protein NC653_026767 [Populus alba x Populus x berolinensis]|uniref:Uncharacterized protein n=1 Tax=Populus alba x Populus x berolinensis TaxID=444605 RepID=A0AAD6M437_9ROSI|nr:hypothetical protein NC653_026767 [Populus alba x Populus x berolinensis]